MKFKVGDKVEVISSKYGNKGKTGTICSAFHNEYYLEDIFRYDKFNERFEDGDLILLEPFESKEFDIKQTLINFIEDEASDEIKLKAIQTYLDVFGRQ